MKIAVGMVLLGVILPSGALAVDAAQPSLSNGHEKVVVARQVSSAGKKTQTVRKIADKPAGKEITDTVTKDGQTEMSPASTDQSVELRGVRG